MLPYRGPHSHPPTYRGPHRTHSPTAGHTPPTYNGPHHTDLPRATPRCPTAGHIAPTDLPRATSHSPTAGHTLPNLPWATPHRPTAGHVTSHRPTVGSRAHTHAKNTEHRTQNTRLLEKLPCDKFLKSVAIERVHKHCCAGLGTKRVHKHCCAGLGTKRVHKHCCAGLGTKRKLAHGEALWRGFGSARCSTQDMRWHLRLGHRHPAPRHNMRSSRLVAALNIPELEIVKKPARAARLPPMCLVRKHGVQWRLQDTWYGNGARTV